MATQKVRPDPNALEGHHDDQQSRVARKEGTVLALVAALVLAGVAFGIGTGGDDPDTGSTPVSEVAGSTPATAVATPSPIPSLPVGDVEPGRYVFATSFGHVLDAPLRITIDVPDGYGGRFGMAALKVGTIQTGVSTLAIGGVYADPCRWKGTLLDRSAISSTEEVVAALATQEGLRVSTPTEVTVDGYAGTYVERRVPARTDLSDCDSGQFRVYLDLAGEERFLFRGMLDLLWIVDVDGVPLVIDASLDAGTSAEVRAELLRMVASVQIDPSTDPIPPLPGGSVEPGRYVFASSFGSGLDAGLDASHRITIDVPDGYGGHQGVAAIKFGTTQTAVSTLAVGDVYADACRWNGALLDRSAISSTDEVVAALAGQEGLRVSRPTDVTVDGFTGTYMERRVPARTDLSDCDLGQVRVYLDPDGEERYVHPGQLDLLWVVDIDGVPLVIDASLDPGTSAHVRAELVQMVESVRIDPREEG